VAKEILRLERDAGIAFSEIGVVARTLEPYADWIQEVFRDHRIPVSTSAETPLFQSPLAKAAILLLNLAGKDYLRNHFVDLVSSPYFVLPADLREGSAPRPDLWDALTRKIGITKGAEQWTRLKRYLDRDLEFSAGEENDDAERLRVGPEQFAVLWRLFTDLHHDLRSLPPQASWSEYVELWQALLPKYLDLREVDPGAFGSDAQEAAQTIRDTLAALAILDALGAKTSLPQFVHTFQRWLERKSVPISDRNVSGVNVLDAMAARGARFRALFMVGLNEGLFPRTIREDAFLRDRPRRVIETVLGYKVSEKLAGFEEEKLLFTLLVGAAKERLYCLYQRSDETGSALEPSWYLGEIERLFSTTPVAIPRSIRAKKEFEPFRHSDFLIPEELAIRLSLEAESPDSLLDHFPVPASIFRRGKKLLQRIEDPSARLAEYDGLAGHLPEYWRRLSGAGVAPTTLERYARCPFQFFALNVLGLWPLERPEDQSQVSASDGGLLVHRILKNFYQTLIDENYFEGKGAAPQTLLEATARKVFDDYEATAPTGYPLLWEVLQEEIIMLLQQTIPLDLRELSESGSRPIALEAKLCDKLPDSWPVPASSLSIAGTLDRIDFHPESNRFRVIDYKFKSGTRPSPPDTHLLRAALRGERLQPPLYTLLGRAYADRQNRSTAAIEAAFYFLAPRWHGGPFSTRTFSAEAWDGPKGESLRETVSFLIRGIHDGHYFIHPGPACAYCDVAQVCRKDHFPTGWRAGNDPLTEPYLQLLKKMPPKEDDE
jgi:ATP-dependent helicase/nuclease subunit B